MLVSDIVGRAARLLYDQTHKRWPESELLDWFNEAQRQIVFLKPNSNVVNESIAPPSPNGTKWTLPAGAVSLVRVVRNMGAGGAAPGRAVRPLDQSAMDCEDPDWHSATVEAATDYAMYDSNDPLNFYVSPPTSSYLEVAYSKLPDAQASGEEVTLSGYESVILDFMLWRAWSKDSQHQNLVRGNAHYNAALQSLGLKSQVRVAMDRERKADKS